MTKWGLGTRWMLGLMACSALVPVGAMAQTAETPSPPAPQPAAKPVDSQPGDIVVTAQRYEQRLQDVPISISAVTADDIKARNATNIADLQYSVPGLSTYRYGPGQEFYQLQGVSNTLGSSTVGLYLGETPMTLDRQGNALSVQLVDMERVEVLRGPQATLYGEGSMGGTIRYIPAAPKLDTFSGSVEGDYSGTTGGGDGYRVAATINAPLVTDKIGVRLTGSYQRDGGWIDSAATGQKDVNDAKIWVVRGTILAKPTERLDLSLMGTHQSIRQDYQDFGVNGVTNAALPTTNKDDYTIVEGKAVYDLDFADLSAIGSYTRRDNLVTADLSPFYVPFLPLLGVPAGTVTQVGNPNDYNYDIFYGELRLQSHQDGRFGWLLGATYRDLKLDFLSSSFTAPATLPFSLLAVDEAFRTKTVAVYGEVSYALTDKLKATIGARYFHQDLSQDTQTTSFGIVTPSSDDASFHSVNPRFNLSYAFTPQSMIYANVAKGFRSGGFNLSPPSSYAPDDIWTYEVGTKHQLFGGRLSLDGSVYRSEWSDVQSYLFAPGSPIVIVSNSGHVAGWGADATVSARPVRGLTLAGTYGWNNLEFDEATGDKQVGDPVDGAVRESWSASLDYRAPMSDTATAFWRVDYQHAGSAKITFRNFGQIIDRPSRDLINLRMGVDLGGLELAVFANNLFDIDTPNIIGPFGVFAENLEQRPQVIGVSGRMAF